MSHLLAFPPSPLPPNLTSPPYAIIGLNGTDLTRHLPRHIPLNLLLHFAPTLRPWILPPPHLAALPHSATHRALLSPSVGLDIHLPIQPAGLQCIIMSMLHASGVRVRGRQFDSLAPDVPTSLAIRDAWCALRLPGLGLQGLRVHVAAQMLMCEVEVGEGRERQALGCWDSSELVEGWGVVKECVAEEKVKDGRGRSEGVGGGGGAAFPYTGNLGVPRKEEVIAKRGDVKAGSLSSENKKMKEPPVHTGYQTIRRKAGKLFNPTVTAQTGKQACIMEQQATRHVSPQERQAREERDFAAMKRRLRRTRSDDSLRSVDTAVWDPQMSGEDDDEGTGGEIITIDLHNSDCDTDTNESISDALSKSLETIRLRREARLAKNASSVRTAREQRSLASLEQHGAETGSLAKTEQLRLRRSFGATTVGEEHGVLAAELEERIRGLGGRQSGLMQRGDGDGGAEVREEENVRSAPVREWIPGFVRWTGLDDDEEDRFNQGGTTSADVGDTE
ncbi:hypothetical protein EKO04_000260 [Ascochyta lentis]|uniref:Uncharacterized protein n=1 Tax=Ascochyta lentis TaxID=205686 RepID=A0A8H7MHT0_9PLEO|nr:hypothetical protein EKO04_000260 [Ascochyta lentis]